MQMPLMVLGLVLSTALLRELHSVVEAFNVDQLRQLDRLYRLRHRHNRLLHPILHLKLRLLSSVMELVAFG